jgi:hypothetical protein
VSLFGWLRPSVSAAEVRAEIWSLGQRHMGWPLEGALKELEDADVAPARADLLRACVRQLRTH